MPALPSDSIGTSLPSISAIRHAIELAWQAGFDEISAQQFGHTLETHAGSWIGTTECATLFRYFGIAASVHAFPVATLAKAAASAAGKSVQTSAFFSAPSSSNFKTASKSSVDPSFNHHKLMAFVCAHFKATAAIEPGKQLCSACILHCKQTAKQQSTASSSSSSAASSVGKGSTTGWFRSMFENDELAHWLAVASPADLAIASASSASASKSTAGSKGSAFKVYSKALGAPLNSAESDASQSKLTSFFGGANSSATIVSAKRTFGHTASSSASFSVEIDDDDDDFQDPKRMRPVAYVKSAASSWPNISPAITGASRVCPSCGGPGTMGVSGASSASSSSSSSSVASSSSFSAAASGTVLPLFLQHRGHSRTIIGVERLASTGEYNLLVLDPSTPCHQLRAALSVGLLGSLRVSLHDLGRRDYEIVRVRADAPMTVAQRARSRVIEAGEIQ